MNWKESKSNWPEYKAWVQMKGRCRNPDYKNFKDYGGRGITVCERWLSFDLFYQDMGRRPEGYTLGRKDNDGPYSPENCRWETARQQSSNKRSTILVNLDGRLVCLAEYCRERGVEYSALHKRIKRSSEPYKVLQTLR